MGYLGFVAPEEVSDPASFCRYVCQTIGTPYAFKDEIVMRRKVREFFEQYPHCSYGTLVRLVQWARSKKKRPARAWYIIDMARYAWADGALPEMDPQNVDLTLETKIRQALESETDPEWRRRLMTAEGDGRRVVFQQWTETLSSSR